VVEPSEQERNSTRFQILNQPAYQERCEVLFELFEHTRTIGYNPQAVLAFQAGFCELVVGFQEQKSKFKKEGNALGVAITNRLIAVVKRIVDAMAWRYLGFNRVALQLLSEHQQTGHIDDTIDLDFAVAKQAVDSDGSIVIINDLTTALRYGDVTVINKDSIHVIENKTGKGSRRSGHTSTQKKRLNEMLRFINLGVREVNGRRDFILSLDTEVKTHHGAIDSLLSECRSQGCATAYLSDCLAVRALYYNFDGDVTVPETPLFSGVTYLLPFNNLQIFENLPPRFAPYGIFPLSHRNCFDLLTGNIILVAALNLENLARRYKQAGLSFELPNVSDDEMRAYVAAPIHERKKLMDNFRFTVSDGDIILEQTMDRLLWVLLEFLHEDTVIQADQEIIGFIRKLDFWPDKTTRFYVGYKQENGVWK
jgi:hypothetical protein